MIRIVKHTPAHQLQENALHFSTSGVILLMHICQTSDSKFDPLALGNSVMRDIAL